MTNTKVRDLILICLSGAIGGVLWWLGKMISAGGTDKEWWLLSEAILGGCVAAGVGVYVLANTNTDDLPRALFFAALCGFSWEPIVAQGEKQINETIANRTVAENTTELKQIIDKKSIDSNDFSRLHVILSNLSQNLPETTADSAIRTDTLESLKVITNTPALDPVKQHAEKILFRTDQKADKTQ